MNVKYFAALTAIVLATELSQPLTHAQASQVVLTSMFNDVLVQRSPLNPSLSRNLDSPPPIDGRPDDRTGAGTRAAQPPVAQPEAAQ
jgi:hypothetical protein